jgi:hypothetical protein
VAQKVAYWFSADHNPDALSRLYAFTIFVADGDSIPISKCLILDIEIAIYGETHTGIIQYIAGPASVSHSSLYFSASAPQRIIRLGPTKVLFTSVGVWALAEGERSNGMTSGQCECSRRETSLAPAFFGSTPKRGSPQILYPLDGEDGVSLHEGISRSSSWPLPSFVSVRVMLGTISPIATDAARTRAGERCVPSRLSTFAPV